MAGRRTCQDLGLLSPPRKAEPTGRAGTSSTLERVRAGRGPTRTALVRRRAEGRGPCARRPADGRAGGAALLRAESESGPPSGSESPAATCAAAGRRATRPPAQGPGSPEHVASMHRSWCIYKLYARRPSYSETELMCKAGTRTQTRRSPRHTGAGLGPSRPWRACARVGADSALLMDSVWLQIRRVIAPPRGRRGGGPTPARGEKDQKEKTKTTSRARPRPAAQAMLIRR
jgi:hypothetical protein